MNLDALINSLMRLDPATPMRPGFSNPHSYRGVYADVAFSPVNESTAGEMLGYAKAALGSTFQGWKGGEFTMDGQCYVYLAERGDCGEAIEPLTITAMILQGRGWWELDETKRARFRDLAARLSDIQTAIIEVADAVKREVKK